jgi:hypothetical protein
LGELNRLGFAGIERRELTVGMKRGRDGMSLNPIWNFGCVDRRSRLEDFSPYCVGDMDLTEKLRKKGAMRRFSATR